MSQMQPQLHAQTIDTTYEEKQYRKQVKDYRNTLKQFILTSRFNTLTWEENRHFVGRNMKIGCIYCAPSPLSSLIPLDTTLFILEMNNDVNKIMGIGLVNNHPRVQKYSVYQHGNYNRYSYIGKHRIDRIDMDEEEEKVMRVFDILCFTGNTHMKRGQGLKQFPIEMLYKTFPLIDLVVFIRDMFKKRMTEKKI